MGREVRRVPRDWEHPRQKHGPRAGSYLPLFESGYAARAADWEDGCAKWCAGWRPDYAGDDAKSQPNTALAYSMYSGQRPVPGEYMPDWPEAERTHYQMYEDTSEGTPISPVMETPEALARWLADNGASSFGSSTATYEQWLNVCRGAFAPSAVHTTESGLRSGVEAASEPTPLMPMSDEKTDEWTGSWCCWCGPDVSVDEEGCCGGCGSQSIGHGVEKLMSLRRGIKERLRTFSAAADSPRVAERRRSFAEGEVSALQFVLSALEGTP